MPHDIKRRYSGAAVLIVDTSRCSRRICHTSPARGGIAGRRWRGCHNSAAPFGTCAAGFPPSLQEAVRKYHYPPYRSMRTGCHSGLQGLQRRSLKQLVHLVPLSQAVVLAARPVPLLYGFCTRNTVYSVFKVPREARSTRLSLSV